MKKWIILNKQLTSASRRNKKLIIDNITKILLQNRGITSKKEIEEFLQPSLDKITYQSLRVNKKELDRAVGRIKEAVSSKESVIVWTDYDVDGICSGAIIWETLYAAGCNIMPFVPHRKEEGYGLSKKGIDKIKKEYNPTLIITVDHGITGGEKIAYAKNLGIDTIILDHHLIPKKLPKVEALIHTTELCATGIAWFFANYLIDKFGLLKIKNDNLDLVALATVADLVPLLGANRALVYFGLKKLNATSRIGLKALIREAGLENAHLGVYEIGHILAPRINAMGRLEHALDALRLICTRDTDRARLLSVKLNLTNRNRQIQTEEATLLAAKIVRTEGSDKLIFISHESFAQGIIGLVAGRLVDEFNKPVIVIARGKDYSKASCRSINGFNIVEFISLAKDLLIDVGGHPMAAGFTVETGKIERLKEQLIKLSYDKLQDEKLEEVLKIDAEIDLPMIDNGLYKQLLKLVPYGMGNSEPVFASFNAEVVRVTQVGKDRNHLKLFLRQNPKDPTKLLEAIGFKMGDLYGKLQNGRYIDVAYRINDNVWNGRTTLQLKLKDVKFPTT